MLDLKNGRLRYSLRLVLLIVFAIPITVAQVNSAKITTDVLIHTTCIQKSNEASSIVEIECKRDGSKVSELAKAYYSQASLGKVFTDLLGAVYIRPKRYKVYITNKSTAGNVINKREYQAGVASTTCLSDAESKKEIQLESYKRQFVRYIESPERDFLLVSQWLLHDCTFGTYFPSTVLSPGSGLEMQSSESYQLDFVPEFGWIERALLHLLSTFIYLPVLLGLIKRFVEIVSRGLKYFWE